MAARLIPVNSMRKCITRNRDKHDFCLEWWICLLLIMCQVPWTLNKIGKSACPFLRIKHVLFGNDLFRHWIIRSWRVFHIDGRRRSSPPPRQYLLIISQVAFSSACSEIEYNLYVSHRWEWEFNQVRCIKLVRPKATKTGGDMWYEIHTLWAQFRSD